MAFFEALDAEKKSCDFLGNINQLDHREKLKLESILDDAFPNRGKKFIDAYHTLLPEFTSGFLEVEL